MNNNFMKEFVKRLTKGLLVGGAIVLFMLLSPLWMGQSAFSELPWYLVPVVILITLLYGTGWYFAFNLIKRTWRKVLRVGRGASLIQALTGRGLFLGIVYSIFCFVGGCLLAFIVGNYFMLRDYLLAKQGKPPVSMKYKFDSDLEYDTWAQDIAAIKAGVIYNDMANDASTERRMENAMNLDNIERGYVGTVTTTVKENGEEKTRKTTIS